MEQCGFPHFKRELRKGFVSLIDEVDALRKVGIVCTKLEWFGKNSRMCIYLLYFFRDGKKHNMKFDSNIDSRYYSPTRDQWWVRAPLL